MAGSTAVVQATRATLRERGMTYRDLAVLLGLSEPTVKRDLGHGNFSLRRLDRICDVLGVTVEDLIRNEHPRTTALTELSTQQGAALVADSKLLLVTCLIVNDWRFGEMMSAFRIDENELISLLLKLDRLRIIEYRPPRRIRKLTARNFPGARMARCRFSFSRACCRSSSATRSTARAMLSILSAAPCPRRRARA